MFKPASSTTRHYWLFKAAVLAAATLIVLGGCSRGFSATPAAAAPAAPRPTGVGVQVMKESLAVISTELPGRNSAHRWPPRFARRSAESCWRAALPVANA